MLRYVLHGWTLLGYVVAVVVGLGGHNLVQTFGAAALGDRRPLREGFARWTPRQLDPLGTVTTVLTHGAWGWAGAVPVEARFPRLRFRAALSLLLGPAYLFGLTVAAGAVYVHAAREGSGLQLLLRPSGLQQASLAAFVCCAGLCVVSLAPFPPLALGRALWLYAPTTPGWQRARYAFEEEAVGSLVGFAFLMLPLVFTSFPDVVGRLAGHLADGVLDIVG